MTGRGIALGIQKAIRKLGFDVIRTRSLRHPIGRRMRLIERLHIDLVIDVGANEGQYGSELRASGYRGRILSFEPLAEPFAALADRARADGRWDAEQVAIGSQPGRRILNVAANSGASSSFLSMLPLHETNAPEALVVSGEEVRLERLDVVAAEPVAASRAPFLKADVQGYELEVLKGASGILDKLVAMQLELSLAPLYEDAPLFGDVLTEVRRLGFELVGLEPGFVALDGRLLQVDGLFARTS